LLTQDTLFDFEVIVGDDCSTDNTSAIVDRIAASDKRVRVLRPSANIGVTQNLLSVHNAALGEYVAHLDGDDFAAAGKLARQAAVLDGDPTLALCGHRMIYVYEDGADAGASFPASLPGRFDLRKLIRCGMPVMASSIMYRREARTLRSSLQEIFDWYLYTDIMRKGDGAFLPEILGGYRVNRKSLTSTLGFAKMQERMLRLYVMRLAEWPQYKADFFARVVMTGLAAISMGAPITSLHRQLIRRTFSPFAVAELVDGALWLLTNRRAMVSR
jgi:glycosyltransferase involved in cell wall biosynthesis